MINMKQETCVFLFIIQTNQCITFILKMNVYIVSTLTRFDAFTSTSASFILYLLKLQIENKTS